MSNNMDGKVELSHDKAEGLCVGFWIPECRVTKSRYPTIQVLKLGSHPNKSCANTQR